MDNIPKKFHAFPFVEVLRDHRDSIANLNIFISALSGFCLLISIPYIHFGLVSHLWDSFNYRVDKIGCTCPCWDTIFKGYYERGPAGYKHIYFNITSSTFFIWIITMLAVILLYESTKRMVYLYLIGDLRKSMAVLFCLTLYSHYYSWWAFFNYLNDSFYRQWYHQMYFSITELLSTIIIVDLLNKKVAITTRKLLLIGSVAVLHVILATYDQFVYNIVLGNGKLHQVLRDFGMMIPDIVQIVIPVLELQSLATRRKCAAVCLISNKEFFTTILGIFFVWMMGLCL